MRAWVAQNASPLLLAYWLGIPISEVEADPVAAVDDAAPLLWHLMQREGWIAPVRVANPQALLG